MVTTPSFVLQKLRRLDEGWFTIQRNYESQFFNCHFVILLKTWNSELEAVYNIVCVIQIMIF